MIWNVTFIAYYVIIDVGLFQTSFLLVHVYIPTPIEKITILFLYLSLFYRVSTVASSAAWILLFLLRFCWNCVDFINWFGANKNICNTIIIYKYYHIIYAYAYIFMFMLYIILYYYITIFTVLSVVSIIYVSHQSFIHFCYVLFLDASISLLLCLKSCSLLYFLSCYC